MRILVLFGLMITFGFAQQSSLSLSSGAAMSGQTVPLILTLNEPTGVTQPAALQWSITFPTADVTAITQTAGQVLIDASKTIQCNVPTNGVVMCLADGLNMNPIAAGPVTQISVVLAATPVDSAVVFGLSNTLGSDAAGNALTISPSGGTITVQQPITSTCPVFGSTVQNIALSPVQMVASGGTGLGYVFIATGLPTGLVMASNGIISGTSTVSGVFLYTTTITDSVGNTGVINCSINVMSICVPYKLTRTPVGPVLIYRNGVLQKSPGDYTSTNPPGSYMPIITPVNWTGTDTASAVYTKAVPLSFVFGGQTVSYWGYTLNREDWSCVTGKATLTPKPTRRIVRKTLPKKLPKKKN